MPIEDIRTPKAPADWRPSTEQQRRIQEDSRLKRMSRDDLYFYFNQPKTPAPSRGGSGGPPAKAQPKRPAPASGGILGPLMDYIARSMQGGR